MTCEGHLPNITNLMNTYLKERIVKDMMKLIEINVDIRNMNRSKNNYNHSNNNTLLAMLFGQVGDFFTT